MTSYRCAAYRSRGGGRRTASRGQTPHHGDRARFQPLIRTLKREEIHANCYRDLEDLRTRMGEFIERYYNRQRLHSALGYRSPEAFEQAMAAAPAPAEAGPKMSFFRHREIYRSDDPGKQKGRPLVDNDLPEHRIDESPTGYSSAGCSPAEPASASPAATIMNRIETSDE